MRRFVPALVFLCALLWFTLFQPWGGFADPDAFYHAKIASLIAVQGPLHTFPWLDLTSLGTSFTDHHFLFHLLLIPFQKALGMLWGAQVASVFFAALFLFIFFFALRRFGTAPLLATVLAASSSGLIVRLSLAKASPLALAWFVAGMVAAALRRPWLVGLFAFGFALTHGGWILLIGAVFFFAIGEALYDVSVLGMKVSSWRSWNWSSVIAAPLGAILGTIIHPNFPDNIRFLWVQVVKIGLLTPGRVVLGQEWAPVGMGELVAGTAPIILALLATLYALLFARRQESPSPEVGRRSIGMGLVVAVFLALTLKSRRSIEYLIPVLVLWVSVLWNLVDPAKLRAEWVRMWRERRRTVLLFGALGLFMMGNDLVETRQSLFAHARSFEAFRPAMAAISAEAEPGERVFHADWDQFPQLFVLDDRLRYIAGLDPTFLLEADPALSDAYQDVTWGRSTTSVSMMIHDVFHSSFVFLERPEHEALERLIRNDVRFELLYEDDVTAAYKLRE